MKIGFACLTVGVEGAGMRTCRKASATEENLKEIIQHNLQATETIIRYSIERGLKMYRMSSDLIPFGSDLITNNLDWQELFKDQFQVIGQLIKEHNIRTSMHPGQYTVLNSPDENVVSRAIDDLEYHNKIMESMGLDRTHKFIIHIGGVYGDKKAAKARFVECYAKLSAAVKSRLIIENDDRLYTIKDVLEISELTGAPVVYDNLHNACNLSNEHRSDSYWIELAKQTWRKEDGPAKVHYSQQRLNGRQGAHTATIYLSPFMTYYKEVAPLEVDIMLEVKDKNLSAVKVHLATAVSPNLQYLKDEWFLYKYTVFMHSPAIYEAIDRLLEETTEYPVSQFYELIETALDQPLTTDQALIGFNFIWKIVAKRATANERTTYKNTIAKFLIGEASLKRVKSLIKRVAVKYSESELLDSLFFEID